MINIKNRKDTAKVRRIALAAQGLLHRKPFGAGLSGVRAAINHLGYVQIDTISVVERAHHHVLYCRVPNFNNLMINRLLQDGEIFEYWAHAAAFLPITDFRFSLPYKHAIKNGQVHWYRNCDRKLMSELLARIRSDGALRSRDLEKHTNKSSGWWDWKPAKKALEQLYMEGDLMVSDRAGFQKSYDLTERVLPSGVDLKMPNNEEFAQHLVEQQLRCHGVVSLKGMTYLRRNTGLRKAVKIFVDEKLKQKELEEVRLQSGESYLMLAGVFEQPSPRVSDRLVILSPFDNSVIQRERLKSLFEFDYQIECYVPEAKRKYGYFCLPLLYRDEFIGRMDCKAHRKTRHLEIKNLYLEPHRFDSDALMSAFVTEIKRFCQFQQCDSVSLYKAWPQHLTEPFQAHLKALD
ncbi:winged helix DNA-binding domain-containing protein [Parasalinivibrio latis]|uniref:winged helix-turn-helix domain-containing protein n=1 Tax=Parasalinivibrio latis TaxID=2952610 RepID=UPI0030E3A51E